MNMFGGKWGGAHSLIVWNDTSPSDSWSELALSSCWLGTATSSRGNAKGCALAGFLDLGILDY